MHLEYLEQSIGKELGVSRWLELSQERIAQFAELTLDRQWIHVDEERAKRESPYGVTIAHGFLTLSLLSTLLADVDLFPEGTTVINYGLDKVRFLNAVKAGSRIRNQAVLLGVEPKEDGRILVKIQNTVEIEHEKVPAMIAESLALVVT